MTSTHAATGRIPDPNRTPVSDPHQVRQDVVPGYRFATRVRALVEDCDQAG